jgi:hypothetical protein
MWMCGVRGPSLYSSCCWPADAEAPHIPSERGKRLLAAGRAIRGHQALSLPARVPGPGRPVRPRLGRPLASAGGGSACSSWFLSPVPVLLAAIALDPVQILYAVQRKVKFTSAEPRRRRDRMEARGLASGHRAADLEAAQDRADLPNRDAGGLRDLLRSASEDNDERRWTRRLTLVTRCSRNPVLRARSEVAGG